MDLKDKKVLVFGSGKSGWSETRIVAVFSVVTAILCLIAFLAL